MAPLGGPQCTTPCPNEIVPGCARIISATMGITGDCTADILVLISTGRVIHLPNPASKAYASRTSVEIQANYTLTFDLWAEAWRTHSSPVRLRPRRSWRRVLAWIITPPLILILLLAMSIIRDPTTPPGAPAHYTVDLIIPF